MKHVLPELPFPKNALEPFMSAETLEYHHGRHHKAYVDNLNKLIQGTEFENMSLEQIIVNSGNGPVFNNAAQTWNHTFFWNCLTPKARGPQGELLNAIQRDFGSLDHFKDQFAKAAIGVFGSGWAWLVLRDQDRKLSIETSPNAVNPLTSGRTPILTCDVWEHAYYIDYRNERPKFVQAIWNIVNWEFAERNFVSKASAAA